MSQWLAQNLLAIIALAATGLGWLLFWLKVVVTMEAKITAIEKRLDSDERDLERSGEEVRGRIHRLANEVQGHYLNRDVHTDREWRDSVMKKLDKLVEDVASLRPRS